ncbi:conserved hypothetical protein [Candidatus Desulfarcum epimagneticum]|uniref:Uncharacterized protein n=1 Tax=uncultured Desulfobacteraceae bacterium TaxID=218296 RepID=A0A484HIM8_9BACT|nr:conserved hypothetical protein [uncultured Desulfobacteraceae bacterium]
MVIEVKNSKQQIKEAKINNTRIDKRSITDPTKHWAEIDGCAEDNPDLTHSLIKEILLGAAELDRGELSEYKFE